VLIYLEGCGSVLVLGASPPLGYENSFTYNDFNSERGKTDPLNWPTCHGALPPALTARYGLATAAVASRESLGLSSLLSISPFFRTRVTYALQLLLLQNSRLLPSLPIPFALETDPVCSHRAETVPASLLPHCKLLAGY
jgi:hypothetical protein